MSQATYEIIRKLFEIYPIILQIVLFLVLWNVFFRWEKGIWIVAGILAVMNICMGLWLEKPGVIRYTMSAVIVLGYCFCKYQNQNRINADTYHYEEALKTKGEQGF